MDVLLLALAVLAVMAFPRKAGCGGLLAAAYVLLVVTVVGPLDDFARRSLVGHMVGHLAHTDPVAPTPGGPRCLQYAQP